jgi:hypothetical protein
MLEHTLKDGPVRLYVWLAPILLVVLALVAGCGGGDDNGDDGPGNSPVATPIGSRYYPIVISSDLAVGEQRFQVGLIDQGDDGTGQTPVAGAQLHFKFYLLNTDGQTATERFDAEPEAVTIMKTYTHTHEDGTVETHEAGETGVYITYVTFDTAALWGVEVSGTLADGTSIVDDGNDPVRPFFQVSEKSAGLAVGDPAPASRQTLASDVADIRSIDTSLNPIPEEHNLTIADAIVSGKPTVIAFATPAFCITQLCGPTKEIFDGLYEQYKGQANFIHIEPYDVDRVRAGECQNLGDCVVPALNDFRLDSEPWVFIVDAQGKVAAKYDGVVSENEMEQGLQKVLSPAP